MTSRWLGEYDGRYNNVIPDCVANPCATVRTGCFSKDARIQVANNGPPLRGPGSPGDWGSTPSGPPRIQVANNGPPLRGPGSPGDWGSTPSGPPNRLLETLS